MDFDDLLRRYFGTAHMPDISPAMLGDGVDRLKVDLGLATDAGHRFALWCVLYMLNEAPDLDVAFSDPAEREAARNFMDLMAASNQS